MPFRKIDVEIERIRRSGPGGQHRNRRETGVRLIHIPTGLRVLATEERSQARNLEVGLKRLKEKVRKKFLKKKIRKETKPTRASRERRLGEKRKQSEKKKNRNPKVEMDS